MIVIRKLRYLKPDFETFTLAHVSFRIAGFLCLQRLRRRHWFRPGLLDVGALVPWICPVTVGFEMGVRCDYDELYIYVYIYISDIY